MTLRFKALDVDLADPPVELLKSAFGANYCFDDPIGAPFVIEYDSAYVYISAPDSPRCAAIPVDRVRGLIVLNEPSHWKPIADAPHNRALLVKTKDDTTHVAAKLNSEWWATEVRSDNRGAGFVTKRLENPAFYREIQ
jgi:hypothetical protein